jgi:hypothetical protein
MTSKELAELHRLVGEADAFAKRPFEEGETSRPITLPADDVLAAPFEAFAS